MDNRIREMDIDALFGLSKLHSLTLKRCHPRSMPPVAHVKYTLINLGVAQNLITHIPVDYFKGFVQLQTLFLSVNRLTQFPDVHPLNLTQNSLYLLSNRISLIPQSMIPSCSKLKQNHHQKEQASNAGWVTLCWAKRCYEGIHVWQSLDMWLVFGLAV